MGRKRKPRRQGKAAQARAKWQQLLPYVLDFLLLWHPPSHEFERSRGCWQTWQEYLADWIEVREYARTWCGDGNWGLDPEFTPFAELVYQHFGKDGPPEEMSSEEIHAAIGE